MRNITIQTWIWPQEGKAIWTVYPYNSTRDRGAKQGDNPGNPPTSSDNGT